MILKAQDVKEALLKKGFRKRDGHHHFYEFVHNGRIITKTWMSHNDQEINDYLIQKMRRQCLLSKKQFVDLVDCPFSQKDYENELRAQRQIN